MTAHFDPLAEHESLRKPFVGSLILHACVFTLAFSWSWMAARNQIRLGDPNATPGGAIPINIVRGIPLAPAQTLIPNPVASDSRSAVPMPPPEPKAKASAKVEEPPDAIPLPGPKAKVAKPAPKRVPERKFRPYVPERDNQLYAAKGMGVNTSSFTGLQPDAFGVGIGVGAGTPFGAGHGWYVEALQRRIGEQWQKELMRVGPEIRTAPVTVVSFEILRDGSLRSIRVRQSSGLSSVDYAAQRAVTNSNPVPPLPAGLNRSSVTIEVWFELKR
jgi:protein TonB